MGNYIYYFVLFYRVFKKKGKKKKIKSPSQTAHCAIWDRSFPIRGINPNVAKICQNFSLAPKYIIVFGIFEHDFSPQNPKKRCTFLWVTRYVRRQYRYALGKELLIYLSRHSLTCTFQPRISILWQKYSFVSMSNWRN